MYDKTDGQLSFRMDLRTPMPLTELIKVLSALSPWEPYLAALWAHCDGGTLEVREIKRNIPEFT